VIKIVLYPGELQDGTTTRGHLYIYVDDQLTAQFAACAGPSGPDHADRGGHTAGPTPAGNYILGPAEHHTTSGWPLSTIPWGADLRRRDDGEIEWSKDGETWRLATGPDGDLTQAGVAFQERSLGRPLTDEELQATSDQYRRILLDPDGNLEAKYHKNDFGEWAWNLNQPAGSRTPYFLHTTPSDEAATASGQPVMLTNSHGCIHITPADRDQMVDQGWLKKGVPFVVQPYGWYGPEGLN
jgi:hypothetical protein